MMTAVFLALAGLALFAALHPYTTFPLSLWLLRASGRVNPPLPAADPQATPPRLAILMCVHNEENVIHGRMTNLIALADRVPGTEILVYVDGSTDRTQAILERFGDRIQVVVSEHQTGKTPGMNLLVTRTDAPIVVFTDAAVRMDDDSLTSMLRHFDDPAIGCVCGRIIAVSSTDQLTATADTSIRYWAFDALIRELESDTASVIGAHGPLFAIRRALHEPAPPELFDDMWVSLAILYAGHRVVQARDFVGFKAIASKGADEFTRKTRIACQSVNIHRLLAPRLRRQPLLIRYCYASHKVLRWATIYSLSLAGLFATVAALTAGYWLPAMIFWLLVATAVALGFTGIRPFAQINSALAALIANGLGIIQSLRGITYQTWSPVKSARESRPGSANLDGTD